MRTVYSVGQINKYIKGMFADDALLSAVFVRGEVSNCKYHTSGHIYFSLKDDTGTISCIMFAGNRRGLKFPMKDGDKVICGGNVDVYERDGRYQLYAREIALEGAGILYEKFLALKKQLEEMGMFDARYKKPIPAYAERIGVVTAPTGAAIRDIENISHRRNPYVQIVLYPSLVQGEGAAESIVRGIEVLDRAGMDIIIVGRGGGSYEDLWAFNEEVVARAIFACSTPVISAVGHETDTTIADFAADLRAPTPSAAAELAVFDYNKFQERTGQYAVDLERGVQRAVIAARGNARWYQVRLASMSPVNRLNDRRRYLTELSDRMESAVLGKLAEAKKRSEKIGLKMSESENALLLLRKQKLAALIERFKGLSPLARLQQGFSYVSDLSGNAVTKTSQTAIGELLNIHVTDGRIQAEIREIKKDG